MKIGVSEAVLWTLGAAACFQGLLVVLISARPEAGEDLVLLAGVQVAVYLAASAWFSARRAGSSWSEVFAVRRTSVWLLMIAALLGVTLGPPTQALVAAVEKLAPLPPGAMEEFAARLRPKSLGHGVALFLVVCGFGPLVEELFFRGALFTALRPGLRPRSAALLTATLFTLTHPEPRFWPSLIGVGLIMGFLRAHAGSLWPPLLLHASFNGTALLMSLSSQGQPRELGALLMIASLVLSLLLLSAFLWLGRRSALAEQARGLDLDRGSALPEGAS